MARILSRVGASAIPGAVQFAAKLYIKLQAFRKALQLHLERSIALYVDPYHRVWLQVLEAREGETIEVHADQAHFFKRLGQHRQALQFIEAGVKFN
ncbi:hypothetical protein DDE05_55975 [Streptomyces cavourensis]|nr:hypothetical protein DDE05_55975 [Streptomyces cavourensis]